MKYQICFFNNLIDKRNSWFILFKSNSIWFGKMDNKSSLLNRKTCFLNECLNLGINVVFWHVFLCWALTLFCFFLETSFIPKKEKIIQKFIGRCLSHRSYSETCGYNSWKSLATLLHILFSAGEQVVNGHVLTHLFPMSLFSTLWKHQKTL